MQSVARKETLASSSTNKASQNPGFSLKIKAKKMSSSSSGAQKKARSIQKKRGFKRSGASMKLDELNRKLGVQEEELRRAIDRAELAEKNLKGIEEELQRIEEELGENMKQLEQSAEKAVEREEKLKDKILNIADVKIEK